MKSLKSLAAFIGTYILVFLVGVLSIGFYSIAFNQSRDLDEPMFDWTGPLKMNGLIALAATIAFMLLGFAFSDSDKCSCQEDASSE